MARTEPLRTEREHHKKAFEIYVSLGARRSYDKVAGQMGVSPSSVRLWAKSFQWQEHVREREAEEARQIADRALKQGFVDSERNLKIVRAAILRIAKGIADSNIKWQVSDIDRLIRLEEHLLTGTRSGVKGDGNVIHKPVVIYLPDNNRGDGPTPTRVGVPSTDENQEAS